MKFPVIFDAKKSETFKKALDTARTLHEKQYKYINVKQMYCPYCGYPLSKTDRQERMETLDEHVMDPNGTPSYKTVYKCSCRPSRYTMWNYLGESYLDLPKDTDNDEEMWKTYNSYEHFLKDTRKMEGWSKEAINSICFISNNNVYAPGKTKEWRLRLWKSQKIVPTIDFTYEYDNFGKCKWVSPSLKYLIRSDKLRPGIYSYSVYESITTRLKWRIDTTKRDYRKYRKNPNERNLKQLYGGDYVKTHHDWLYRFWYTKIVPFYFGKIKGIKLY